MPKKIAATATHPSTLRASAQTADDASVAVVADTPKTVYEINYTTQQRGHNSEIRDVIVAAEKMSDAVAYIESQGGIVSRANAVLNGATFINL